ncbi:formyltransferase family protein [Achromobacter veterisilvae]|uniref:Formyltransferase family protein n=1 Tax=Achromobacter veterisilvae TaxID=2069367 RepID=A0ABZ2S8M5_9BURK
MDTHGDEQLKIPSSEPRIALFVDDAGFAQLLPHLPVAWIGGVVAAGIRPQYIGSLRDRAGELGLPLLVQPRYDAPEFRTFVAALTALAPNRLLSNSYSMIIRPEILGLVDVSAALNVHAAALPRNRGPNPIQWALIRDEVLSGVTIHQLDAGLDTGAVVAQSTFPITDTDTWKTLHEKALATAQKLFRDRLQDLLWKGGAGIPQDERMVSKNRRLNADSPRLDPASMSDREIFNWIRAQVHPLGGAYVQRGEERHHVRQFVPLAEIPALRRELNNWLEYQE